LGVNFIFNAVYCARAGFIFFVVFNNFFPTNAGIGWQITIVMNVLNQGEATCKSVVPSFWRGS